MRGKEVPIYHREQVTLPNGRIVLLSSRQKFLFEPFTANPGGPVSSEDNIANLPPGMRDGFTKKMLAKELSNIKAKIAIHGYLIRTLIEVRRI